MRGWSQRSGQDLVDAWGLSVERIPVESRMGSGKEEK